MRVVGEQCQSSAKMGSQRRLAHIGCRAWICKLVSRGMLKGRVGGSNGVAHHWVGPIWARAVSRVCGMPVWKGAKDG